jgi:GxxExxY protein
LPDVLSWKHLAKFKGFVFKGRRMNINQLSSDIIGAAIQVHQTLGPGLLESVYQKCMVIELEKMNRKVQSEVPLTITYRGQVVAEDDFRLDLLVEDTIIVELKSVEEVKPVHQKQLLTYLRLAKKPLGLLLNFNVSLLKDGITRIITQDSLPDFPLKNQAKISSEPLRSL